MDTKFYKADSNIDFELEIEGVIYCYEGDLTWTDYGYQEDWGFETSSCDYDYEIDFVKGYDEEGNEVRATRSIKKEVMEAYIEHVKSNGLFEDDNPFF